MTKRFAILILFVFCAAFLPPARSLEAAAQQVPLPEVSSRRLLNDLQVSVAVPPSDAGGKMTVGLVVRYGASFDPAGKGGLAYLTSRMFGHATLDKSADAIQRELKALGASLEVRCDWDGIRFLLHGRSADYERSLLLLYQIVCEAEFKEEDFTTEKTGLLKEIQAPPDPRQQIRFQLEKELFRGTTYGRPLHGTAATVGNITAGDVRHFYHRFFSPSQAALVLVGSAPSEVVLLKAARIWGIWVRAEDVPFTFLPPRPPASRMVYLQDDPESPAAQFILGNLWPRRDDSTWYSGALAARILQDRLTQTLPTSLLTVGSEGRRLSGLFYMQGQAAAGGAVDEIKKIIDAVDSFKKSGVTEAELEKARGRMIGEFRKSLTSTDGVCNVLLDAELYRLGANYMTSFDDFVRRGSLTSVQEAAKSLFLPGGFIILVRGPSGVLREPLESFGPIRQPSR